MEGEKHTIVSYRTFVLVWVALLGLTAITMWVWSARLGTTSLLVPLGIATAKGVLVLWFFMHLKYERMLVRVMLLFPILTLAVIIGLTFLDVLYR